MKQEYKELFYKFDHPIKEVDDETGQSRGRKFENLINDILDDEGVLIQRPYRTYDSVDEQIDGAIEVNGRILLIEVKWVESGLAASDLYAFLGKVDNKFSGTLGVFISRIELSKSVLAGLNKGRQQKIIAIHGKDLDKIFAEEIRFKDFISRAIKELSTRNESYFSVEKYLDEIKSGKEIKAEESKLKQKSNKTMEFIESIVGVENPNWEDCFTRYQLLNQVERLAVLTFFMSQLLNYYNIGRNSLWKDAYGYFNISRFIEDIFITEEDSKILKLLAKEYYTDWLFKAPVLYGGVTISKKLSPCFKELDAASKIEFEKRINNAFNLYHNNFDAEDSLTIVVKPVWNKLTETTRNGLIDNYLKSLLDVHRKDKYPMKSFAKKLLTDNQIPESYMEGWIKNSMLAELDKYKTFNMSVDIASLSRPFYIQFGKHLGYGSFEDWKTYINTLNIDKNRGN